MKIVNWLEGKGFLFCAPGIGVDVENKNTRFVLYRMGRRAGVPDLIVWVPGGTVGIEVKKPAKYMMSFKTGKVIQEEAPGRQSDDQKEFEKRMNAINGHHYLVAYDLADVQEYFWLNHIKAA
jgi:hypothetical protein